MFDLSPLPFAANALEPLMSRTTLETHHGKHHAAYIKKTNALIEENGWNETSLEEIVRRAAQEKSVSLFNNAAQAWNHAFFWQCLTPQPAPVSGDLKSAIERKFGSVAGFRGRFLDKGEQHFGSGWLWLSIGADSELALTDLHDAQTPIIDSGITPILTCDLWEHAYYLDHKNQRRVFLEAMFDKLLNWRFAQRQYESAKNGGAWRFADWAKSEKQAQRSAG